MVPGAVVPAPRRPPVARPLRRGVVEDPAARRRVADLPRRRQRRRQRHRRGLCGAALARPPRRRAGAHARPAVDRVQGRPAQHPRVHALLAGADRRMALGQDAEPAAGSDLVPAVVSVLDLQFRAMGARDADADRAVVGAPAEPALAAGKSPRRAVSRRSRRVQLRASEEGRRRRLGPVLPPGRQGAARAAGVRRAHQAGAVAPRSRRPCRSNGSCATRTPTAPGAASSRRGSTA